MAKLTSVRAFNKALQEAGIPTELVKGEGYFYFTMTDEVDFESVYVYAFNHLTPERWQIEFDAVQKKWNEATT